MIQKPENIQEVRPGAKLDRNQDTELKEHEKLTGIANSLETDSQTDYVQALKNLIKKVVAKL